MDDIEFDFEATPSADEPTQQLVVGEGGALFQFQAKDKIKRIVCRHWLKHECQRGDACTYLHEMDYSRMPDCDLGANCNRPGCIFKHPPTLHDVGVRKER